MVDFPTFRGLVLGPQEQKLLETQLEQACRRNGIDRCSLEAATLAMTIYGEMLRGYRETPGSGVPAQEPVRVTAEPLLV